MNDRVALLRALLSDVERDCAEMLEDAIILPETASLVHADIDRLITTTLLSVGAGVTAAIRAWAPRQVPWRIFVWPGYERIAGAAGRAVLRRDKPRHLKRVLDVDQIVRGTGRQCDRALPTVPTLELIDDRSLLYESDLNVEWFNLLLREQTGVHSPRFGSGDLGRQPPSTHAWFALTPDRAHMPRALCVRTEDISERMPAQDLYNVARHVDVRLSRQAPADALWSAQIASQIEVLMRGARGVGSAKWPAARADLEEGARPVSAEVLAERLLFYDIWLTACFYPERTLEAGFIEGRLGAAQKAAGKSSANSGRWKDLEAYLLDAREALKRGRAPRERSYKAWYSIPIIAPMNHRVSKGRMETAKRVDPHLGTAMILSDRPIDVACLEVISAWVRSMYLELRALEIAALEVESATEGLTNSFGHEVSKITEGLFDHTMIDVDDLSRWPTPPLAVSGDLTETDRELVEGWKVVTSPDAQKALQSLLHTWGSVSFSHWGLPDDKLTLTALVDGLSSEAHDVAAARLWIDNTPAPTNMENVRAAAKNFEWARKETSAGFHFVPSRTVEEIIFHRPTSKPGRHEDRFAFLARLLMALMSNVLYHAPRTDVVSLSAEREGGKLIFVMKNVKGGDKQAKPRGEFRLKSDGVVRSCLHALGGSLDDFPRGDETNRIVETKFTIPTRHADDAAAPARPWIEVVERRHG